MSLPENPEMTAAFNEIFTRKGPDGNLVYPKEDVDVLKPVFLMQIARNLGLDALPPDLQGRLGAFVSAIGIREGMSEEEQVAKMRAYLDAMNEEGAFNKRLLEEVRQVYVKFGMNFLGEEQKKQGEVYQEFSDTREAPKAPRKDPTKKKIGGPGPRRGVN